MYECEHVSVFRCTCARTCMCTWMWGPDINFGCHSSVGIHLVVVWLAFKTYLLLFHVSRCSACGLYLCGTCVHFPRTLESLGLELQMLWAVPGCLGSNSGPLEEQLVLFTEDPSLALWARSFHWDLGLTSSVRLASKPRDLPFSGSPADCQHLCIPTDGSRGAFGGLFTSEGPPVAERDGHRKIIWLKFLAWGKGEECFVFF